MICGAPVLTDPNNWSFGGAPVQDTESRLIVIGQENDYVSAVSTTSVPTLHKYTDDSGYFIRSNINGNHVTLQLSPAADGLLSDLNYTHGDTVSWHLLNPLCDTGHVYTNKSGTDVASQTDEVDSSISSGKLTRQEKRRLEEFLSRSTKLRSSESETADTTKTDHSDDASVHDLLKDPAKSFIKRWSPSEDEYTATLNRLARAEDTKGIIDSVNQHTTQHPIQPNRFQVSSQGVPTYSFETDGIPWVVHHFEPVHKPHLDASMFVEIHPGTSKAQSITIGPDQSEWHTSGTRFSSEQVDELLAIISDVLYYYHYHPQKPSGSPYDIISNPDGNLDTADESRVEAIGGIRGIDRTNYGSVLGVIVSKGEHGYGRVRAHTGHTFLYSSDQFEEDGIGVNDFVSFSVHKTNNRLEAHSIRPEELNISPRQFLLRWPSWQDCSLKEVKSSISKTDTETVDTPDGQIPQFSFDGNDSPEATIEVDIDRVALWSVQASDESVEEVLTHIVRDVLKGAVDGKTPTHHPPVSQQRIQIEMPENIRSIMDSVVSTSPLYNDRSELLTAALQSHVDADDEVECLVSIPRGYRDAIEYVAGQREQSTNELMREVLEESLRDAPELS